MKVESMEKDRLLTLQLVGDLDHHGARDAMRKIEYALESSCPHAVRLDFSDVAFMDSSGIAVVLRTQKRVAALGGALTLAAVPAQARKVFDAAGVSRLVKIL